MSSDEGPINRKRDPAKSKHDLLGVEAHQQAQRLQAEMRQQAVGPEAVPVSASGEIPEYEPPSREYHQAHPVSQPMNLGQWMKRLWAPIAATLYFFFKFAKIIFPALKGIKFLGPAFSMVVSIAAYALIWGWSFAAGFVLLLFIHELGHVIQLKREGIPATAPMFIPFLGAVVGMKGLPRNAYVEAKVGLAGPILGTIGAVATLLLAIQFDSDLLRALAFTAFFLNLFNLIPMSPLDGGRAAAAMSPAMWFIGLLMMVGFMIISPNPILIVILLFGATDIWHRWRNREADREYYEAVTPAQRFGVFAVYVGLAIALVLLMDVSHLQRELP